MEGCVALRQTVAPHPAGGTLGTMMERANMSEFSRPVTAHLGGHQVNRVPAQAGRQSADGCEAGHRVHLQSSGYMEPGARQLAPTRPEGLEEDWTSDTEPGIIFEFSDQQSREV